MLTLNDGRSELWQWDTNRKLTVDVECSQVHFSNKLLGRSIDVDVADGVAMIPDVLLQTDKELTAWAFVGTAENGYTKISKIFKVNRRNKPADYVFTPVEQMAINEIAAIAQSVRDDADAGKFKGDKGDPGERGLQGVPGETGADGKDGYTPVKYVDYFTDADKMELVESVIDEIPSALFETDETLTLKGGVLSVNTAHEPDPNNTLPITSAAVAATVGNIDVLLKTI